MNLTPAINQIFDQLTYVLENLTNDQYTQPSMVLGGSTIGQHTRHTLEFFKCLVAGTFVHNINYDERQRDIFLENNTLEAKTLIVDLRKSIGGLLENETVTLEFSYGDEEEPQQIESNIFRELVYNIEHAIHHMALIKIGLREIVPELKLSEDFGVASSTIRYQKEQVKA